MMTNGEKQIPSPLFFKKKKKKKGGGGGGRVKEEEEGLPSLVRTTRLGLRFGPLITHTYARRGVKEGGGTIFAALLPQFGWSHAICLHTRVNRGGRRANGKTQKGVSLKWLHPNIVAFLSRPISISTGSDLFLDSPPFCAVLGK